MCFLAPPYLSGGAFCYIFKSIWCSENWRKPLKNGPGNLKNRGLEGVWELLGATLRQKISQKLSWLILLNFGRARMDQNLAQVGQDSANLAPRASKLGPRWPSWGHVGSFFEHFWWSWEQSLEKWPKCKNEQHYSVLATFWGLRGSGWRLLGGILGDLDHKLGSLGRSWRQVGNVLATCWD